MIRQIAVLGLAVECCNGRYAQYLITSCYCLDGFPNIFLE